MRGLFVTLSINETQYVECRFLFIVWYSSLSRIVVSPNIGAKQQAQREKLYLPEISEALAN
jgi:hypothetical protein